MLTEAQCRSAKAKAKPYKLADAKGLYLYVTPTGFKSWRWKYRFDRKEKTLTFGAYPDIGLAAARDLRDEAARLRRQGIDPAAERKRAELARAAAAMNSFRLIAERWHDRKKATWVDSHARQVMKSLQGEVFAATSAEGRWSGKFGDLPIAAITPPMVLEILAPIEDRGAVDQAHRVRQRMSDVFVFAIAAGIAENDPAAIVKKALKPVRKRLYPAFTKLADARAGLALVETSVAQPLTKLASRLMALTAVRSEPLRRAEPHEFEGLDGKEPIWRIPASKMKLQHEQKQDVAMEFIVPLSRQAVDVVKAAKALIGRGPLLFPNQRHAHRPMSENAISFLYKRIPEIRGRHVPHGWRSTFSTVMNERAIDLDRPEDRAIIDLMLAHKPEGVEAIYNRAAYMKRRRKLAQEWADMLLKGFPPAAQLLVGQRT